MRAFRHRDFRLLWGGAFLSFTGSWIQSVAQAWLVFEITGSEAMLGLVLFCSQIPVSLIGPAAGLLPDFWDRRWLLVGCQLTFAAGSLYLAAALYFDFLHYTHIIVVATILGTVGAIEMPTRQSIISRVVPPEDLPSAVPLNALTFNVARVIGPSIGMLLYGFFGPQVCYLVNGCSFSFMIFAVLAIRSNLRVEKGESQPIGDLLMEGMLYTFRDMRLRTLFILEACVSTFGLFYLALMPVIAIEILGLGTKESGLAMTTVGVGTIVSLLLVANISHRPIKGLIVRLAMTVFALGLLGLAFSPSRWVAFPLLAIVGFCAVAQFNTTNTLFQLLSPERLRGRVIAMHVWALTGLSPVGTLAFSWFAEKAGLRTALLAGGICVMFGAIWGWSRKISLEQSG
jgi:MFS family permease